MNALNIFLTLLVWAFIGWLVWLIVSSLLEFVGAGANAHKIARILGLVAVLVFLALLITGRVEYFRFIR